jgi:hypothetical protein
MFPLPLPLLAYIETHHRLFRLPSLLYRRAPEILFDAPWRLDPGRNLPAFLFIKDSDLFPIELKKITTAIGLLDIHRIFFLEFQPDIKYVNSRFYYQTFEIPLPEGYSGKVALNFKLDYISGNKDRFVLNDNIPTLPHSPCMVTVSKEKLPIPENWIAGDTHFHSNYTCDEVEYGAPIKVIPLIAKAIGLSFTFLLDHSYDLDDRNPFADSGSFVKQSDDSKTASDESFTILSGEELSAINRRGKTVHAGYVNSAVFKQGYRDSGRTMGTKGDSLITDLEHDKNSILFAAHPGFKPSLLEKLLLNRGEWSNADIDDVTILQIMNGPIDKEFFRSRKLWIDALLRGKKVFVIAGNDAHGDFSKTRKITLPFLSVKENNSHVYGKNRTYIPINTSIIDSIKNGLAVISNGAFIELTVLQGAISISTGSGFKGTAVSNIDVITSEEFGHFTSVRLYQGNIGDRNEKIISEWKPDNKQLQLNLSFPIQPTTNGYIRAEAYTLPPSGILTFAATNPIWMAQ